MTGEIFGHFYREDDPGQSTNLKFPASGAVMVEFKVGCRGKYTLAELTLVRVYYGAWRVLYVEGEVDRIIYDRTIQTGMDH